VIKLENFVSVKEYARLCGVPTRTIHYRVKKRTVSAIKLCGYSFIDVEKSPPEKRANYRQKQLLQKASLPPEVVAMNLITVKEYAKRKKMRADRIYDSIINGKLEAIVIGETVFVDKAEVSSVLAKE